MGKRASPYPVRENSTQSYDPKKRVHYKDRPKALLVAGNSPYGVYAQEVRLGYDVGEYSYGHGWGNGLLATD